MCRSRLILVHLIKGVDTCRGSAHTCVCCDSLQGRGTWSSLKVRYRRLGREDRSGCSLPLCETRAHRPVHRISSSTVAHMVAHTRPRRAHLHDPEEFGLLVSGNRDGHPDAGIACRSKLPARSHETGRPARRTDETRGRGRTERGPKHRGLGVRKMTTFEIPISLHIYNYIYSSIYIICDELWLSTSYIFVQVYDGIYVEALLRAGRKPLFVPSGIPLCKMVRATDSRLRASCWRAVATIITRIACAPCAA